MQTEALYGTILELIRAILWKSKAEPREIQAIAASGHGNGLYLVGKDGIMPQGFSSMCTEGEAYTPDTEKTFPFTLQTSWSGQPLAILSYIKQELPQVFCKIEKILFCKDLVKYILTDQVSTDYTDASAGGLLNAGTASYDEALLGIYGLEDCGELLPRLCGCSEVAGYVSERFAALSGLCAGTKVVGGLFDVNACMLGAGIVAPGRYCVIAGTWGINSAVVGKPVACKEITQCTNFVSADRYMCIDSAPTSCANLDWFLNNVLGGMKLEQASEIVQRQPRDSGLLYLPYIFKPMDLNRNGSFLGLRAEHTYKDMIRSIFEGIVFDHVYRIDKLKRVGIVSDRAVLTGGAANSPMFRQMFADASGLDIYTTVQTQNGALGGAIIGSVAAGVYPDIETAAGAMVTVQECCHPGDRTYYQEKYQRFRQSIVGV